jgi:hypothetical protein
MLTTRSKENSAPPNLNSAGPGQITDQCSNQKDNDGKDDPRVNTHSLKL